jgi:RNA polymerase sigma-70 factor (ECF subfamily)
LHHNLRQEQGASSVTNVDRTTSRLTTTAAQGARAAADRRWSQLMEAAQAGDRQAYDCLLREIVPYIRAVVAPAHRQPDRVDEVVQDVLLSVHRVRHTYHPARPFRHWLAAIARRRSIDALRKRSRYAPFEVGLDVAGLAYEGYADPATIRFDDAPVGAYRLGEALTALPALQRQAIQLLKLREMSLAEAARLTGRSIAALKVNAHRGVKSLQKRMQAG